MSSLRIDVTAGSDDRFTARVAGCVAGLAAPNCGTTIVVAAASLASADDGARTVGAGAVSGEDVAAGMETVGRSGGKVGALAMWPSVARLFQSSPACSSSLHITLICEIKRTTAEHDGARDAR